MITKFRKLLCKILGHRSICLKMYNIERDGMHWTTISAYKCERCDHEEQYQWDG